MKILWILLLFSTGIYAKVVSPSIDEELNFKVTAQPTSKQPSKNNRKLASEYENQDANLEDMPEQEEFDDDDYIEDQERDVASEAGSNNDAPTIRYWKY